MTDGVRKRGEYLYYVVAIIVLGLAYAPLERLMANDFVFVVVVVAYLAIVRLSWWVVQRFRTSGKVSQ